MSVTTRRRRIRWAAGLALAGLASGTVPVLTGGVSGAQSATATLPGVPTGVTATIQAGVATVRWTPPASTGGLPIESYTVLPSSGCPVVVSGSSTQATVTGLPASGTVTFQVAAATTAGFSAYSSASAAVTSSPRADGYRLIASDGGVFNYGTGLFAGSASPFSPATVVDGIETPSGGGYYLVGRDGAVYAFGDAVYRGGANNLRLNAPVVAMSRNADGSGYVLAAADGGVFTYGSSRFAGSAGSLPLVSPITAIAQTPSGNGYWLAAADGGVFAYGDARFLGNGVGVVRARVVDIEATRTGRGYWMLAADGAVYAFGDAVFRGGANGQGIGTAVSLTSTGTDAGYLIAAADGAVYAFGDAVYRGGANGLPLNGRIVAISSVKPVADPTVLQFLQLSDFHGQVDASGTVGGAAALSTLWNADRAAVPNTFTVNSGDNYGAAPAISSFFNEIPTIRAMNLMRFDVNGFGNHEFDKPLADLKAQLAESQAPWVLANHTNVDANIVGWGPNNANRIQPYTIVSKGGIRVAFIGVNTPETPSLVSPGNLGTMQVTDPSAAVNRYAAEARAAGADVVVVLSHIGTNAANLPGVATGNLPSTPPGPLPTLARTTAGADLIYGGHTHLDFQARITNSAGSPVLVQQTTNAGGRYTRTRMCVDPTTKAVLGVAGSSVVPTTTGVTPDPAVTTMLAPFRTQLQQILDPVVGVASALFQRGNTVTVPNPAGGTATPAIERAQEVPVGNLVADAIRWRYPQVQVAIMNGGGLRSPLPSSYTPSATLSTLRRNNQTGFAQGPPFDIVLGDIYTLLPFGNLVVTKTVSGATIWSALENGVSRWPASDGRFPQVSGLRFTFDATRPAGNRVASVELFDGTSYVPLPNTTTSSYVLGTNDFMNQGGDSYTMFNDGTGVARESLAAVTAAYVQSLGTITPTTSLLNQPSPRITRSAPL